MRHLLLTAAASTMARPEHTLAAYRLAIRMGADYVEPDLVSTKDGVLVARHENEISGTTDVADRPEFADRRTTKVVDGVAHTGWFTEDFTLEELKSLRAVERLPDLRPDNTAYDGRYQVPTLQEVVDLVRWESRRAGRTIGIYPETKHPTYFDSIGLSLEEPLVATLRRNGLTGRRAPVVVQSFETRNLRELSRRVSVPLVQLLGNPSAVPYDLVVAGSPRTYGELGQPDGLRWVARYADGVGPEKSYVIPRRPDGTLGEPTTFVDDAHDEGLVVHAYTFRAENAFLPVDHRRGSDPAAYGDYQGEVTAYLRAGVDGLFADHPDLAVRARDAFLDEDERVRDGADRQAS
jgi:glycerophosphoryl diester phosphodiesterase